ncbi:MAG: helix-turn-helix transcriptional regulator [Ktedonobacteraceae bacterium]|nr:helix-turn-helix transcriptional regulator [Ktedonobacteraceae bacterium]
MHEDITTGDVIRLLQQVAREYEAARSASSGLVKGTSRRNDLNRQLQHLALSVQQYRKQTRDQQVFASLCTALERLYENLPSLRPVPVYPIPSSRTQGVTLSILRLRLQEVMRQQGMTPEQLADAATVSLSTVRSLCSNGNCGSVRLSTVERLADALGVSLCELMEHLPSQPSKGEREL